MLAYIANEVKEGEVFHPVVIVDHFGGIGSVAVEIQKLRELLLDGLLIVAQRLLVEELALLAFHRGVADHACGTTHKGYGFMAGALEMLEHHHTHKVADMKRVGRGVDTQIGRGHFFFELFFRSRHHLMNHPAPGQFFYKIHLFDYLRLIYDFLPQI